MNNCSPWIHEIYQGIFEIYTDLDILVVNAKYTQKYTVAYTRFFCTVQMTNDRRPKDPQMASIGPYKGQCPSSINVQYDLV